MAKVSVYPAHDVPEEPIVVNGVTAITYVDNESHGQGPVGSIVEFKGKRAIVSSPNVALTIIEEDD